ncbi:MAG: hypothetical protein JOZ19_15820 [Rubrobacter sp.]|nr:hypothetical protein [Rubrobacter sp.]
MSTYEESKNPWQPPKETYAEYLKSILASVQFVCRTDELHRSSSIFVTYALWDASYETILPAARRQPDAIQYPSRSLLCSLSDPAIKELDRVVSEISHLAASQALNRLTS